jgi:hypothetical protein
MTTDAFRFYGASETVSYCSDPHCHPEPPLPPRAPAAAPGPRCRPGPPLPPRAPTVIPGPHCRPGPPLSSRAPTVIPSEAEGSLGSSARKTRRVFSENGATVQWTGKQPSGMARQSSGLGNSPVGCFRAKLRWETARCAVSGRSCEAAGEPLSVWAPERVSPWNRQAHGTRSDQR